MSSSVHRSKVLLLSAVTSLLALIMASLVMTTARAEQSLTNTGTTSSFRFTATSDSREERTRFRYLLDQITVQVGDEGLFHISVGDIDPLQDNYDDLVNEFGSDVVWFPVTGNHEEETLSDMSWIRDHYPSLPWIVNPGPAGCETTTYSFDYLNAHFVVLNQYYTGARDIGGDGDVVDALYDWLVSDLASTTKPAIFVFGHEPAFPFERHVGDSLDGHPANRDRFWNLLEEELVVAYLCGHTHYYSKYQHNGGKVWQIDLGNAGNSDGDLYTFLDVTIDESWVRFDIWRGTMGSYSPADSWTVDIGPLHESTTISCTAPTSWISEGDSITISGFISPSLSGETVTLTYKSPDGKTSTRTVTSGSDGSYSDLFKPDAAGAWEVTASWVRDGTQQARMLASFEVTPASSWTTQIGGLAVVAFAIVAVIIVLRRRKAPEKKS
jgi:hypothetical protein